MLLKVLVASCVTVALSAIPDLSLETVVMEASPMPIADPFSPASLVPTESPRLFLVQAGSPPFNVAMRELPTSGTAEFCPETFGATGFSVKCLVDSKRVRFMINKRSVRSERDMPFYMNGDRGQHINKFRGNVGDGLQVECFAPGVGKVSVTLTPNC